MLLLNFTHSAASFMPQSSEQYLEPGRVGYTQPGPRHCRSEPSSLASVFSVCFQFSVSFFFCFCFCFSFCGTRAVKAGRGEFPKLVPLPCILLLTPVFLHPPHSTISVTFHSTFIFKFSIFFTFTAGFCSAHSRNGNSSVSLIQGCNPGKCRQVFPNCFLNDAGDTPCLCSPCCSPSLPLLSTSFHPGSLTYCHQVLSKVCYAKAPA